MTGHNLPQEFLLAVACCRWPLSEDAIAAIRAAHNGAIDWPYFLQVVKRQRVIGLVHNALSSAGIEVPASIEQVLATRVKQIARMNAVFSAESIRLQQALDTAQIPVMVLKGIALAQLAYGSLALKQALDIDLLVPADRAAAALQILERGGYALVARHLSEQQRRAVIRYGKDFELANPASKIPVDLLWRLASNPMLFKGVDGYSPTQNVALAGGFAIRTLANDDLFAYLCVHGAQHSWSRLKWLADLNALLAEKNDAAIVRLYRNAQARGAGLCAGQALLLCHRLFALKLPASLEHEFSGNRRLEKLAAIAMRAMCGPEPQMNPGVAGIMRGVFRQFLLGQGWAYFAVQARIASVGLADVIRVPLSPLLHFLYPILRFPLWLWRRLRLRN